MYSKIDENSNQITTSTCYDAIINFTRDFIVDTQTTSCCDEVDSGECDGEEDTERDYQELVINAKVSGFLSHQYTIFEKTLQIAD